MRPDLDDLQKRFGYRPDERGGERWSLFRGYALVVIHPERQPRIYKEGCGGVYYEIVLDPTFN